VTGRPVWLRELDDRWRIERAKRVGIADRLSAYHAAVIDGVSAEPPHRRRVGVQRDALFGFSSKPVNMVRS
jgi:hypothetical protein